MKISPIEFAYEFARRIHEGQKDKAGEPYFEHVNRVATRVRQGGSEGEIVAAYLHDALENGMGITFATLVSLFGPEVTHLVSYLTRRGDETYPQYIERVAHHPSAIKIKLADLEDNMNLSRLPEITDADRSRQKRYQRAQRRLLEAQEARDTEKRLDNLELIMPPQEFEALQQRLGEPSQPNPELASLMKHPTPWSSPASPGKDDDEEA